MKFINIDDMLDIILSADKKTTDFLAYAGLRLEDFILNMDENPLEKNDNGGILIRTTFDQEISSFSDYQIFQINRITSNDIKYLACSKPSEMGTVKEKFQKILLLSVQHCKNAEQLITKKPYFKVDYYIRKNRNNVYFLETRMISTGKNEKEQEQRTQYEIPIYNKLNEKHQLLLEEMEFCDFGY